jgi:hypothetical protein
MIVSPTRAILATALPGLLLGLACQRTSSTSAAPDAPNTPLTPPTAAPTAVASAVATAPSATPVSDLLVSLREPFRNEIAGWLGVGQVGELSLYDITVDVDLAKGTFRARESVDYANRTGRSLDSLLLAVPSNYAARDGEPLPVEIHWVLVNGKAVEHNPEDLATALIPLSSPLAPGARTILDVGFEGHLHQQDLLAGSVGPDGEPLAQGPNADLDGRMSIGNEMACLADWYPVVAPGPEDPSPDVRERVDDDDERADRYANYRVALRTSGIPFVAVASGVPLPAAAGSQESADMRFGGVALDSFVVLLSGSFSSVTREAKDIRISVSLPWFVRADLFDAVLDVAVRAVEVYERRFGPYVLADLKIVSSPLLEALGLSEQGIVQIKASYFLQPTCWSSVNGIAPEPCPTGSLAENLEYAVAHEIAHQWWGGMVPLRARQRLNEGLTQYSTLLYFSDKYGADRAEAVTDREPRFRYLGARLQGYPDESAEEAADWTMDPGQGTALLYGKVALYYDALRRMIGDQAFDQALQRYYTQYRYRAAEPDAVSRLAGEVSGKASEVLALQRRWLSETHGDEDVLSANPREPNVSQAAAIARRSREGEAVTEREVTSVFLAVEASGRSAFPPTPVASGGQGGTP